MRRNRPLVAIVSITVITQLFMIVTDMGPHLLLVAAVCAVVGTVIWLLIAVGHRAVRYETVSEPHRPLPIRLPDLRITLLRQGLSYGRQDNQIPERMYESLVTLVDDELAATHGIDREAEPDAARAIIGDELMRFIELPDAARSLGLEDLERIVTLIELIRPEVHA